MRKVNSTGLAPSSDTLKKAVKFVKGKRMISDGKSLTSAYRFEMLERNKALRELVEGLENINGVKVIKKYRK